MKQYCITITDGLMPTSMPYNEFYLYRQRHFPDDRNIVIVLFRTASVGLDIPDNSEIYYIGNDLTRLRKLINRLHAEADKERARIVFHIHEAKSVLFFNIATFWRYREKIIYTIHSTFKNYVLRNKVLSFMASLACKYVVCVSKTSFKYYPSILKRIKGNNALFIQNGVDFERIPATTKSVVASNADKIRLVYVARLVALKQHQILFNALVNHPEVTLDLIGIGPLEQHLKEEVFRLGIEKQVNFWGLKPREEVFEKLKSSDAFVSASAFEGLPIAVLEAMCCSLPCLVSDIEQHREISELCNSLIIVDNTIYGWVKALSEFKRLTAEERQSIGENNKTSACKNFSLERMHKSYNKLYNNV